MAIKTARIKNEAPVEAAPKPRHGRAPIATSPAPAAKAKPGPQAVPSPRAKPGKGEVKSESKREPGAGPGLDETLGAAKPGVAPTWAADAEPPAGFEKVIEEEEEEE